MSEKVGDVDPVTTQYDSWPYPNPTMCLDPPFSASNKIDRRLFWPAGCSTDKLDILIAGCGTNQAARVAYHNPNDNVVGIDVSATSLRHEHLLQKLHSVKNLRLHELALENVERLEQQFDLIYSHGVLHHLKDPDEGLSKLKSVLKPHGSIHIMVYGKYGRMGLTLLHDLFGKLGLDHNNDDISFIQDSLKFLPDAHPAYGHINSINDVHFSSGVVDAFMHRRERSYSVDDCLAYLERNDLCLQSWAPRYWYYPDKYIPESHALYKAINSLSELNIWRAMELLRAHRKHQFIACHKERPKSSYAINFNSEQLLTYVPQKNESACNNTKKVRSMSVDFFASKLFSQIDGRKTIKELIDTCGLGGDPSQIEKKARAAMSKFWRVGLIYLALRN